LRKLSTPSGKGASDRAASPKEAPAKKVAPRKASSHTIRIIGGRLKRSPIPVLDLPGLRPTPDRVRETVFNWLTHLWDGVFDGRRVLDPFAGTGALGLEAVSRGASDVVLIEQDRRAAASLQALCDKLGASQARVIVADALTAVPRLAPARFDLVLLDPPFGQDWLERILPTIVQVLTDDAIVYMEAPALLAAPPGMELLRQDRAGAVYFHLFRRMPQQAVSF
jgi:16S rRNA (guanine966-N2)-methyltransferase